MLKIYRNPKPIFGSKHGYLVAKFGKERLCCTRLHAKMYDRRCSLGRISVVAPGSPWIVPGFWYGWFVSSGSDPYTKNQPDAFWQAIIADLSI